MYRTFLISVQFQAYQFMWFPGLLAAWWQILEFQISISLLQFKLETSMLLMNIICLAEANGQGRLLGM